MPTATLVPVTEYLSTAYRPDREYLAGSVLERNVGERDHSRLQLLLGAYLAHRERKWGICAFTEQRVQVKPDRFRIPDVCVVAGGLPEEQIFTRPPLLCIEILSKDDAMSEMQERIDDYLDFGVRFVWLIDPRTQKAYVYTSDGMREVKDRVLRTSEPAVEVPLDELFSPPAR